MIEPIVPRILVVDDEKLIRWSLRERLTKEGYEVIEAADGANATELVAHERLDLALLDLRLPDIDGMTLLEKMREVAPELPVIVITAYSSVDSAVGAMKAGALDYVTKPFDMDDLSSTVKRGLETRRSPTHDTVPKAWFGVQDVIGKSRCMVELKALITQIAHGDAPAVLVRGESGSGKDTIARALHYASSRATNPFVTVCCRSLPDCLAESEFFGSEREASSDATGPKKGLFELAQGGTVYFDEIADLSTMLQDRLTTLFERRRIQRIGARQDIPVDIRVIAATSRHLEEAIAKNEFRENLYYLLSATSVTIPPLRNRVEDIPLLAAYFANALGQAFGVGPKPVTPKALEKMRAYNWPGNVREFKSVVKRALLHASSGSIDYEDIVLGRAAGAEGAAQGRVFTLPEQGCDVSLLEQDLLRQALERTNWNQTQAAELLGLTRDQVRYKAAKFGLKRG